MLSPLSSKVALVRVELEEGLVAHRCPVSGGHWITVEAYWKWNLQRPTVADAPSLKTSDIPVSEFDHIAKVCPETRTLMTRYRVGHGMDFRVDRSAVGVWLDGGEWGALKQQGLHHSLHLIFTAPWQKAVRGQDQQRADELNLEQRLGADLVQRLSALRKELATCPDRAAALAYLQVNGD